MLCVCLLFGLFLISPSAAAAEAISGYEEVELGTPEKIYNDDGTVTVSYDIELDPYSVIYGYAPDSDVAGYVTTTENIYFSQELAPFDSVVTTTLFSVAVSDDTSPYSVYGMEYFTYDGTWSDLVGICDDIVWDGVLYEDCLNYHSSLGNYYGNSYLFDSSYKNNGLPFCITYSSIFGLMIHFQVAGSHTFDFVCTSTVTEYLSPWSSIFAYCHPLGYDDEKEIVSVVNISDIREGYGFTLDVDVAIEMYSDVEMNTPSMSFYAWFMDSNGDTIADTEYFTMSTGETLDFTADFTVPKGAVYLYFEIYTTEISTDGVSYLGIDCDSLSLTTSISSIELNTQMMTGITEKLDQLVAQSLQTNENLRQIQELLQQVLDNMGSSGSSSDVDLSEIERLLGSIDSRLEELQAGQEESLTWLEKIWTDVVAWLGQILDAILAIPEAISQGMADLFVPSEGKVEEAAEKADEMLSESMGGAFQAGGYVSDVAGAFVEQSTQEQITFPTVTLTFSGVPWTFGGWEVDIVPEGFEWLFDTVALVIDLISTLAFINAMKRRVESVMGGGG